MAKMQNVRQAREAPFKWVVSGLASKTRHQLPPAAKAKSGPNARKALPKKLQPSRLDLLPSPQSMGAAALGRAAVTAAREPAGADPAWWDAVASRAKELRESLDPQDAALLMNGMARSQQLRHDMVDMFREHTLSRMAYFNAKHLAMVVHAIAKASAGASELQPFLPELKDRVPEFQGARELTMAVTTLARARVDDRELVELLARRVETRFGPDQFHTRELAALCAAYVRLSYLDGTHMDRVLRRAMPTMLEATPVEISQLVLAASRARAECVSEVAFHCASLAAGKVRFMRPTELVDAVYAFGHALEHCPSSSVDDGRPGLASTQLLSPGDFFRQPQDRVLHVPPPPQAEVLLSSLDVVRGSEEDSEFERMDILEFLAMAVHSCAQESQYFKAPQLVGILRSCARWGIPMQEDDFLEIAGSLQASAEDLGPHRAAHAIDAISRLLEKQTIVSNADIRRQGANTLALQEGSPRIDKEVEKEFPRVVRALTATLQSRICLEETSQEAILEPELVVRVDEAMQRIEQLASANEKKDINNSDAGG